MDRFALDPAEGFEFDQRARFNIAPTDPILAIRQSAPTGPEAAARREPGNLRWGLLRGEGDRRRRPLINVRAESIAGGSFQAAVQGRRCLIPADGFYEWRQDPEGKRPIWFSQPERELFAFAGIWNEADGDGSAVPASSALITCEPNDSVRPVHDRMPVILSRDGERTWLDPSAGRAELLGLLGPAPDGLLDQLEVGDAVNDAREDGPRLLDPPMRLF